jgi:hypothetical protein
MCTVPFQKNELELNATANYTTTTNYFLGAKEEMEVE